MKKHWHTFKAALFISLGFLLFGWGIMWLWNLTVPPVMNGPVINFWQALGIFVAARLLVWAFRPSQKVRRIRWKRRWDARLAAMTPEEREKLRQAYAKRCGCWGKNEGERAENTSSVREKTMAD
ncbi:MAG: hypothetical protein MUD08_14790 [Cytophagales bacterium]|jgi:hypothetical protein|nr:hypothetical protein [Cytophagales bacterium]